MIKSRHIVIKNRRDLGDLIKQDMDKDEAMLIIRRLRKLRMPQQFYETLADALSSTKADEYADRLDVWNPLLKKKLKRLNALETG